MRIVSIEPTPSPNSMKLNMDTRLEQGLSYNINQGNKQDAPPYIQQMLEVEGVTGVFQVADFIAVERHPKADWKIILPQMEQIFSTNRQSPTTEELAQPTTNLGATDSFGEVQVFVQQFKGIPMQVRLVRGEEEVRFGLPERFSKAALEAQPSATNLLVEREWVDKGARYGEWDEVGSTVVEELSAAYDEERLHRLVQQAFQREQGKTKEAVPHSTILEHLNHSDWKARYAVLEQMDITLESLPILQKAITDEHTSIRRLAAAYLGEVGEAALPALYQGLKDASPVVRRTAGDAISDIGSKEAMQHMLTALTDRNKLVRWRAARYLYELGDETCIPALKQAEDDPEFEVSLQVRMALERIQSGEEAAGTVWQQMTRTRKQSD